MKELKTIFLIVIISKIWFFLNFVEFSKKNDTFFEEFSCIFSIFRIVSRKLKNKSTKFQTLLEDTKILQNSENFKFLENCKKI